MSFLIRIENQKHRVIVDTRTKGEKVLKAVLQYSLEGELKAEHISIAEAQRTTGIRNISDCVLGKRKTAGGFIWKAAEEKDNGKE